VCRIRRLHHGLIIYHPAIKNDSSARRICRWDAGIVAVIWHSETILARFCEAGRAMPKSCNDLAIAKRTREKAIALSRLSARVWSSDTQTSADPAPLGLERFRNHREVALSLVVEVFPVLVAIGAASFSVGAIPKPIAKKYWSWTYGSSKNDARAEICGELFP